YSAPPADFSCLLSIDGDLSGTYTLPASALGAWASLLFSVSRVSCSAYLAVAPSGFTFYSCRPPLVFVCGRAILSSMALDHCKGLEQTSNPPGVCGPWPMRYSAPRRHRQHSSTGPIVGIRLLALPHGCTVIGRGTGGPGTKLLVSAIAAMGFTFVRRSCRIGRTHLRSPPRC